jgi:uncharacterized protein Yka (UPF0111/DUF47 family)
MFSLQRILGKDDRFFDLLEASAEQACQSVLALVELLKKPDRERTLDEFIQVRRKDKRITEEISEALCKTFVTPLEREDIEGLSIALYKIPKTVEKFGERLLVSQPQIQGDSFDKQVTMLRQATETVCQMVKALRRKPKLQAIKDQNERLQFLEGQADELMLELLRDLYSGRHEALRVIILRHLYELLERVIDRCRDAGNVVFHIVLKHS